MASVDCGLAEEDAGRHVQAVVHYGDDGCDWYYGICSYQDGAPPEGATINDDGTWTAPDASSGDSSSGTDAGSGSSGSTSGTQTSGTCPEATTTDDRGEPRDADGHIRYCWPTEANCYCDRDNDCYALDGYVPCAPYGSTTTTDSSGSSSSSTDTSGSTGSTTDTTDAGGSTGSGSTDTGTDVLPAFDSATDTHVRNIISVGISRGNRRNVFAKIGDSITESGSFLYDFGYGWYTLGNHSEVLPVIQRFVTTTFPDGSNSFNRPSFSAVGGWTSGDALEGGSSSPLVQELNYTHPMFAIVMYGTNDMQRSNLSTYTANMNTIVDTIESFGTVPILSTIPPRNDSDSLAAQVLDFNNVVRNIASTRHLPLIDYYVAMMPLPSHGISDDGIHPNLYLDEGGTLTDTALQYGYNTRNLTFLQMMLRLMAY
jgi:lysophospholipase L1-like esterase